MANDFGNLGHVPPEWAVTIGRNTRCRIRNPIQQADTPIIIRPRSGPAEGRPGPSPGCDAEGYDRPPSPYRTGNQRVPR